MEKKTRNKLFLNILGEVLGIALFIVAVNTGLAYVGIAGTFVLVNCTIGITENLLKAIKEKTIMVKVCNERNEIEKQEIQKIINDMKLQKQSTTQITQLPLKNKNKQQDNEMEL